MSKPRRRRDGWTENEDAYVRAEYHQGAGFVAEKLGRSVGAVMTRASFLGVKNGRAVRWTPEKIEALEARYVEDGPQTLADEFGMTAWAIVAKARRLGLGATRKKPPTAFKWTHEMVQKIKDRYEKEGAHELAKEFGTTVATVYRVASHLGFHTIAGHARAGKERAVRNKSYNIHYFDKWSPSMAYILGFLFADGNINKKKTCIRVQISRRDEAVLHFIKKETESRGKIYEIEGPPNEAGEFKRPQLAIMLNSTIMAARLMELGMMPRKTYRNDPFPDVPDEVMPHFVRGNFDGDGSASVTHDHCSVMLMGPVKFTRGIRDVLARLAGMRWMKAYTKQGKTAKYAVVTWTALHDIKAFFNYVYPEDCGFYFERKHRVLSKWLADPRFPLVKWTEFEDEMVRRYFYVMGTDELAGLMGKTANAVRARVKILFADDPSK